MFAKPTEMPFFVYILRREKSPLVTFSPKGCSHTADGLPAKAGQPTLHPALLRLAAQMGCPGSSENYTNFEKIRWEQIFIMRIWQHPFENLIVDIEYI